MKIVKSFKAGIALFALMLSMIVFASASPPTASSVSSSTNHVEKTTVKAAAIERQAVQVMEVAEQFEIGYPLRESYRYPTIDLSGARRLPTAPTRDIDHPPAYTNSNGRLVTVSDLDTVRRL